MKTREETSVLRYDRLHRRVETPEELPQETTRVSKLNDAITWAVLSVCLVGWAVVGFFLWIPRVLRAVLDFSVALINATLTETDADAAGRRLRSAANFYRRGFVSAVESIRPRKPGHGTDQGEERPSEGSVRSRLIVREAAWAIVVWYIVAWTMGLLRGTPFDIAAVPWSELWAEGVEAMASIPQLFRR
jgi:hypothetical protein